MITRDIPVEKKKRIKMVSLDGWRNTERFGDLFLITKQLKELLNVTYNYYTG